MSQKLKLIGIIVILIALPLTVIVAQQVQNIVNRAAGPDGKLIMGMSVYEDGYTSRHSAGKILGTIDWTAQQIGQYPATWSIWTDFGDGSYTDEVNDASPNTRNTFPSQELLNGLTARNISPVIFMQSVGGPVYGVGDANNDPAAKKYSNASIAKGSFDAYLTKWANDAKAYNKPVILRYDQEMNGNWFPWSKPVEGKNLANFKNLHNTPENFVKSWQHIYNVIHPIAPKVKFFWSPIEGSVGSFTNYFPGNAYVDYVGFDAYERPNSTARTMLDLYDGPIKNLKTLSNKPIIIGETGVDVNFPNRSAWLTTGYPAIYNNFPDVAAIIYFNMGNWDLSASPEIKSAYAALAAQPRFQGRFAPFTYSAPPPVAHPPTGYHDGSDCSISSGWTCDPDNYNQSIDVHFYEGGTFLGAVTANQTRADLPGAGVCGGTANHGFSFNTPQSLRDGNAHSITAYAINIGPAGGNPVLGYSPKTITCAAPTQPPTPTNTPTPTLTPTPTPEPTATSTPLPTSSILVSTPTFTPTPTPGGQVITTTPESKPLLVADGTRLSFVVGLDSIGTTGTNRVSTFNNSNKSPKNPKRPFAIEVFDNQNKKISDIKGGLNYISDTKSVSFGKFTATVSLGKDFSGASYIIKIKTDGFLRKEVPGILSLKTNEVNTIPQVNLIGGDINSDNRIDILDYNLLVSCSIFAKTEKARSACNSNSFYKIQADINDDGNVNELDYGYFLQEYSVQNGD